VRAQILRTVVRPVIAGTAVGLAVAWWLGQFLQAFLVEVDARDPWTAVLVAGVLLVTALVAGVFPARRAARTDPAIVLRAS
jgi:ABC-type lipoprotein release transport system permease subunit